MAHKHIRFLMLLYIEALLEVRWLNIVVEEQGMLTLCRQLHHQDTWHRKPVTGQLTAGYHVTRKPAGLPESNILVNPKTALHAMTLGKLGQDTSLSQARLFRM